MSKERLEELLELHEKAVVAYEDCDFLEMRGYLETLFLEGFIDYLIEQAERLHGTNHKMGYIDMHADCNRMVGSDSMKIHKLEQQNKELLEDLATIGNAIHEGEISGRGTDENLILEIVDKHWRNRNE